MGIAQSEGTSKSHRLQKQAEWTEAIHWKRDTLEMLKPIFVGTTDARLPNWFSKEVPVDMNKDESGQVYQ